MADEYIAGVFPLLYYKVKGDGIIRRDKKGHKEDLEPEEENWTGFAWTSRKLFLYLCLYCQIIKLGLMLKTSTQKYLR